MGRLWGRCAHVLRSLAVLGASLCATPPLAEPFSFVVVGDQPYGKAKPIKNRYLALIDAINAQDPDLVIHVGDTKSGGSFCSDELLAEQLDFLNRFAAPTLYTPGDNEWTDCYRPTAGAFDPEERLNHIRETYFDDPDTSFGQSRIALAHQGADGFPENARAIVNDVMFVTAHVVGSNNNFEANRPGAAAEFATRDAATRRWLVDSFAAAGETKALVLAIHGDMFEFGFGLPWDPEGFVRHSGFALFAETLIWQATEFDRPVLLVYGDSHKFRMFRPFPKKGPNIVAVETFGDKHMHALRIGVTPDDLFPFAVQPLINPDQPLRRGAETKKKQKKEKKQ